MLMCRGRISVPASHSSTELAGLAGAALVLVESFRLGLPLGEDDVVNFR